MEGGIQVARLRSGTAWTIGYLSERVVRVLLHDLVIVHTYLVQHNRELDAYCLPPHVPFQAARVTVLNPTTISSRNLVVGSSATTALTPPHRASEVRWCVLGHGVSRGQALPKYLMESVRLFTGPPKVC